MFVYGPIISYDFIPAPTRVPSEPSRSSGHPCSAFQSWKLVRYHYQL